jgi:hypothetical protein
MPRRTPLVLPCKVRHFQQHHSTKEGFGKIMMFRRQMTVLAAIAMALAGAMEAQARPDTRTMTCPQAKAFVKQNKAIVMSTGPSTYERIVIGQGLCSSTQIAKLIVAPTVDERKCRVGYTCEEAPNDR